MKKIAIDMDDVICDGGYLYLVNQFLNTNYTLKDVKGYYIQDLIPEEKKEEWKIYYTKHNLYDYVNFLENAYEVMEKLSKHYELYVLTAYVHRDVPEFSGEILKQKYDWLYQNLPFISPDRYIFTTDKSLIQCDVRIDDKLSNLTGNAETKILFTSYHNQEYTKEELEKLGVIRANNWLEIQGVLL